MRVRKPTNTGTLKNIGKFPSLKNKSTVWFESHLERDFIYLLEFDKDAVKYQEQPFKVQYFLDGKPRHYTPDFFVERQNKKQVIEVKPQSKIEKEEFINFSNQMKIFFAEQGYEFLVITDLTIRSQLKLTNIKMLWRYARIPITAKHEILIHELFKDSSSLSFSQVYSLFCKSKEQNELIYSLLFHGYLVTDIEVPITRESRILLGGLS